MHAHLQPPLNKPHDLDDFWQTTLQALQRTDLQLICRPAEETSDADFGLYHLSFKSLGGVDIHGYMLQWKDDKPRPLVVHSHGYQGQAEVQWSWARTGVHVLGVDIRGFGRSAKALPDPSSWGYILTGYESPESYVLRGAVCDYIRAVQVGRTLLNGRIQRMVIHGVSFAGALALMAEALLQEANFLTVGVPTFGWMEGRYFFVKAGSGSEINRFLERHPYEAEDLMLVLRYFDPMHFADRITCPTLVGIGREDDVVPSPTVYAIANRLNGPSEIIELPVSHSNAPEERLWLLFEAYWLRLAMEGVPPDFGMKTQISAG